MMVISRRVHHHTEKRVSVTLLLRESDVEMLDRAAVTMTPKTSRSALIEHLMLLGLVQDRKVLEAGTEGP